MRENKNKFISSFRDKKQDVRNNVRDALRPWTFEVKNQDMEYQEKSDYYRFKSHGLAIHPPDGPITDIAIFHFTPNGLTNINEAEQKGEKIITSKMVFKELLLAIDQLVLFLSQHQNTHLSRITEFQGETNAKFARFLQKYFGMEITEIENFEGSEPRFAIKCSVEQLIATAREFKEKHKHLM